ncbi:MAG: sorbitol dehydrogenase [Clostridia bacterium]|jgi:threonine dehydrogenase-like Zn-dependent dehydrogenase|nr:sorbitol dehydrogenase [Clostridia bacterium]
MKGLVVNEDSSLSIVTLEVPQINDYQALVKVESCGVCNGTDLKLIHKQFKGFDTYPAVLGHEGVGRVVEKGKFVTSFEIGDVVLLPFLEGMQGEYYSAWGAYSEYAVVGDAKAMIENGRGPGTPGFSEGSFAQQVVPGDIDVVDASMIITFREVLSACKRFGFKENESIVIFGAGPVGLSFTKFAKLLGMGPIIVFDIVPEKLEEAAKMGADFTFNSLNTNVGEQVKSICNEGADYVVDAVGINELINQAMELVKYNGKICCYGISPKLNMNLDWTKAPYNWTLQFVQWPSKFEESVCHRQIVSWIQTGVLNPKDFISDVIAFEDIKKAFELVETRNAKKKIVIRF